MSFKKIHVLSTLILCIITFNISAQGKGTVYVTSKYSGCKFLSGSGVIFTWSGSSASDYCNGYGTIQTYDSYGNKSWKYIGNLRYGKSQGSGNFYNSDGSLKYSGNWENDYVQGKGTQYYDDGSYYVGYFEKDLRSGQGTYYWPSGNYYTGQWSNGKQNGYGKEVSSSGQQRSGYYENGQYVGNSESEFSYIASDKYGYGTLTSKQATYWKYYVPANTMGVFTLKNESKLSDLDISVYSSSSMSYALNTGTNSGIKTELITVPVEENGRYIYVKIYNSGYATSKYNFYPHFVDFVKKGEEALIDASAQYLLEEGLKWIFGIEDNNSDYNDQNRNVSRASTVILSSLKGENLGGMTKRVIINEITATLRREFGYDFWGNLLVNYAIGIVDETYKNYW